METLLLFRKGIPQAQIARQLKVARQTVSRWVRQYREGGKAALRKAGRAGRLPKLDAGQPRQPNAMLVAGPESFGYPTPLWTCPSVAEVIEAEFGVRCHPGHVWKLLRALGFRCQRPVGRAIERDEKAIAEWKQKRWPAMKKILPQHDFVGRSAALRERTTPDTNLSIAGLSPAARMSPQQSPFLSALPQPGYDGAAAPKSRTKQFLPNLFHVSRADPTPGRPRSGSRPWRSGPARATSARPSRRNSPAAGLHPCTR